MRLIDADEFKKKIVAMTILNNYPPSKASGMRRWLVERPKDEVVVTIMKNKLDGTYSFVNLTKEHICPCKFESVDDALKDIDEKINSGEVIRYFELR